jgi:signal transduction histidine kinase
MDGGISYYEARIVRCGTEGVLCVSRNITERKQAEKERTQLLRRLVAAQEEERNRIARELHDHVGQYLAALMLGLKSVKAASQAEPHIQSGITKLQEMTIDFSQEVRHLALELRPPTLDDLGLHTALLNYLEQWSERYGILVDFQSNSMLNRRFPPHIETSLYRVIQEALNNVLKHAQAQHVSLVLEHRGGCVLALIEDDGYGFNVDAALNAPIAERRLGLTGMRERAESAGGTLGIESSPGVGTTLVARIPVPIQEEK